MRELKLSDFGLETLACACDRKGWGVSAAQKWVRAGLLAVVVVGTGRSAKHLVAITDADAFAPPPRGRPRGRPVGSKKKSDAPKPTKTSTSRKSGKKNAKA